MKDSAQAVVIGGGVVGCSIAYHLANNGMTDVVLIERKELTSGSSWHAAGGLYTITRPNFAAQIHKYTYETYSELEKLSGQSCGFHVTGGLNLCRTPEEADSNYMLQSACRRLGLESHFVTPHEAHELAPVLSADNLICALWEQDGGHVDPASATQAFAAAARKLGVEIYRHMPVIRTKWRQNDKTWLVGTENGLIEAQYVVNAAGLWGREVGAMAGIELPILPVEHHYLVTESISQIENSDFELPQINDNEIGVYARQEGQGLLLGAYERNCKHWAKDGTPLDFGHELLSNDLSRMEWNFNKALEVMPCLGEAGIKRIINGPMIFSPDLGPLLGPHPELENYFCANAVMTGFNQGAGIGKVISEWIIQGEPEFDISGWDVARFGKWTSKHYTEARTKYFYENRSEKVYPYQEFDAGRPLEKPAVYDRLKDAGGVFGESFGLEHPNWFDRSNVHICDSLTFQKPNWWQSVIDEGKRIRNEVGLMEFSAMAKFKITGPGAKRWLNYVMANRMPPPGKMRLTPMLSANGRLIGDFSVACLDENHYFALSADYMQLAHFRHMRQFLPSDGVTVKNVSPNYSGLHICGPQAQALISRVAEEEMDTASFPFMRAAKTCIGGIDDVIALRVSYSGETGYEMYLPCEHQLALFDLLMQEGKNLGVGLVGSRSLMTTRLEKSFPAWGLELSPDYTTIEAEVHRFVRVDKDDFVGKRAVLNNLPPREKLVTVVTEDQDTPIWGDEAIFLDGHAVGYVTSSGFGPQTECQISLGYVNADAYSARGRFAVEVLGNLIDAEIYDQPLYDPDGIKMRS